MAPGEGGEVGGDRLLQRGPLQKQWEAAGSPDP